MGFILLIIITALIIIFDKRIYKTYYTPSIILSVPFIIITILYDWNSEFLGFKELNYSVLYIWVFGLIFFWITGVITTICVPIKQYKVSLEDKQSSIYKYGNKLIQISFLLACVLTFYLYKAYILYINAGGDAVEEYLGRGVQAHLIIVLKLFSIISFLALFGKGNKLFKLKNLFVVVVVVCLSIMYATKSGVLVLLLSYFFAWLLFLEKKIKLYHILAAFGFGFAIFFISYSLVFGYLAPVDFIWKHMLLYYVSGVASMNAYFSANNVVGLDVEMLYRTIFNVLNIITGNVHEVKTVISEEWTSIGNNTQINVKTFFGTIYLYGGAFKGILAIVFYSFNIHLFFRLSKAKDSFVFMVLYCLLLAMLFFGWFDFYYNTVQYYESIIIAMFIYVFNKSK